MDGAAQLARCDELTARRQVAAARDCYQRLRRARPGTVEGRDAERAVRTLEALAPTSDAERRYFVLEPYSERTGERLRLTSWEKLDFGVTAFSYGLSIGFTVALATEATVDAGAGMMVAGGLVYTTLAVTYVSTTEVDRGDLPLALGITSYLPLTTALAALAGNASSPRAVGGAVAGTAALAIPLAVVAAAHSDLDPGDTQLVRDAGFWGLVLGVATTVGVTDSRPHAAVAGLGGLYGGMALGLLAAAHSEVSLERVRIATWGGYAGALLGGLAATAARAPQRATALTIATGSGVGLLVTFLATRGADQLPGVPLARTSWRSLEPTALSVVDAQGHPTLRPALTLLRGRF
jgi:hypothetical protein